MILRYVINSDLFKEIFTLGKRGVTGWGHITGNGENTSFWSDPWLEGGVLWDRFRHLFKLSVDHNVYVVAMKMDGWEVNRVG